MAAGIKYNFAMTADDIERGMVSIKLRAASLRNHVHCIAVSILSEWAQSGAANVAAQRATKLLDSVDASHKQKIVNWFAVFANFEFNAEEKAFKYTNTTITVDGVKAAKDKSAFDLTKDPAPVAMDLIADLTKLIAKAKKARTDGKGDKVPSALLKALDNVLGNADTIIAAAVEAPATEEVAA